MVEIRKAFYLNGDRKMSTANENAARLTAFRYAYELGKKRGRYSSVIYAKEAKEIEREYKEVLEYLNNGGLDLH